MILKKNPPGIPSRILTEFYSEIPPDIPKRASSKNSHPETSQDFLQNIFEDETKNSSEATSWDFLENLFFQQDP